MSDMRDYLQKKAAELGLERGDQLAKIQKYLDEHYSGQCRAGLYEGVLAITTQSSSLASELRLSQVAFTKRLQEIEPSITKFAIHIR